MSLSFFSSLFAVFLHADRFNADDCVQLSLSLNWFPTNKSVQKRYEKKEKKQPFSSLLFLGEIDRVWDWSRSPRTPSKAARSVGTTPRPLARVVSSCLRSFFPGRVPFRRRELLLLSKIHSSERRNESKNRIVLDPNNTTRQEKQCVPLSNRNDDEEEQSDDDANSTLCLNCAFVAANCVVVDETANMVMVFVTTTTTSMRAGVQKREF